MLAFGAPLSIQWEYINEHTLVNLQAIRHHLYVGRSAVAQFTSKKIVLGVGMIILQEAPFRQYFGSFPAEYFVVLSRKRNINVIIPRDEAAILRCAECAAADEIVG